MTVEQSITYPVNALTKKIYQGINARELLSIQNSKGYRGNKWATFMQWKQLGFAVQKGEKGTPIMLGAYKDNEELDNQFQYHGFRSVFNVAQVKPLEVSTDAQPKKA